MPIIYTDEIDERWMRDKSADVIAQVYNGLDCCLTYEIHEQLYEQLLDEDPDVQEIYRKALEKQAPIMEMELRGLGINNREKASICSRLQDELRALNKIYDRVCMEVFEQKFNPNSPTQMKLLFYSHAFLGMKEVKKRNTKGKFAATVNEEALVSFIDPQASFIAGLVLLIRGHRKQIAFLETRVEGDGRMRSSYNIAGTNTGRLASSASAFGSGTNAQNITPALRQIFCADEGMVLINIDLEQADARNVGAKIWNIYYESHGATAAGKYLDTCESGDLHTLVTSMVWDDLDWPNPWENKAAKAIASQPYQGIHSYRDKAKGLGHGTNFYGTPRTMSKTSKTSIKSIEDFQRGYFDAFPLIGSMNKEPDKDNWHNWIKNELTTKGYLKTPFGRRRYFFNRMSNQGTLREAIAYEPQSMTGSEIDNGLVNVWKHLPEVQLLAQVHDSILLQIPFAQLDIMLPQIMELLQVNLTLAGGRDFFVPLEAKVGFNWNYGGKDNPYGILDWTGKETRTPPVYSANRRTLKEFLNA